MFPKKDPSEGVRRAPTWSLENFKEGGMAAGWLEGPSVWLDTHHWFVTVPCHRFLTGGKLKCPHCERNRPIEESGYVAWLEESGKPMCTTFKKYARPILAKLKANDPIALGKGKKKTDPIWVKARSGSYRFTPTPGTERTAEEFERWLLRLWKAPDLLEFFAVQPDDLRPIGATPGTEDRQARAEEQFREWAARQPAAPAGEGMTEVGDSFPNLRAFRDRPSGNGKHE